MTPELQLMRWVRCLLAREFEEPHQVFLIWDFILGGVYTQFMRKNQHMIVDSIENSKNSRPNNFKNVFKLQEKMVKMESDPLINLEMLCTSMILSKKELLMESDFSMCFAYLLQMEGSEPGKIIRSAIKIKTETFKKIQA